MNSHWADHIYTVSIGILNDGEFSKYTYQHGQCVLSVNQIKNLNYRQDTNIQKNRRRRKIQSI